MTTISHERLALLDTITLEKGAHEEAIPELGMCFVEFADWLTGVESGTDNPKHISPTLCRFGISLNDSWDTEPRQALIPYGPRMVGTSGDGQDKARTYLMLDWRIRTHCPAFLSLAGLDKEAAALRGLQPVENEESLEVAERALHSVISAIEHAPKKANGAGIFDVLNASGANWGGANVDGTVFISSLWREVMSGTWEAIASAMARATSEEIDSTVEELRMSVLDLLDRVINPSKAAQS